MSVTEQTALAVGCLGHHQDPVPPANRFYLGVWGGGRDAGDTCALMMLSFILRRGGREVTGRAAPNGKRGTPKGASSDAAP